MFSLQGVDRKYVCVLSMSDLLLSHSVITIIAPTCYQFYEPLEHI